MPPLGVPQIVAAVAAAGSVLDAGCGSARLTLALVEAGAADVVGIDTTRSRCRVPHAMRKVGRDPQRLNTAPEAARAGRGNIQIV